MKKSADAKTKKPNERRKQCTKYGTAPYQMSRDNPIIVHAE